MTITGKGIVTGYYEPNLREASSNPDTQNIMVIPGTGYDGLSRVQINGDSNFVAENIKSGVKIWDITGTYSTGIAKGVQFNQWSGTTNKPSNITLVNSNLLDSMFYNRSASAGYWTHMTTFTNIENIILTTGNVPQYCFYYCANLNFANMAAINNIANYAFTNCYKLNCNLQSATTINYGNYAFRGCNSLVFTKLTCNRANTYSFYGCTKLGPKVKLDVKYLSANVLGGCTNITKVWLSSNCTNLFGTTSATTGPFNGCTKLTDIYVQASAKPSNFNSYWGYVNASCQPTIHYNITEAAFDAL